MCRSSALSTRCTSREFAVEVKRSETNPSRFGLSVSPRKGIVKGEKTVDIDVTPYGKDGKPLGTRKLPLRGWVVGDVQPSSDGVVFGTQDVGAPPRRDGDAAIADGSGVYGGREGEVRSAGLSAEAVSSVIEGTLA